MAVVENKNHYKEQFVLDEVMKAFAKLGQWQSNFTQESLKLWHVQREKIGSLQMGKRDNVA